VLNGLTLIGIALFIFYEAIDRFANPPEVASTGMLIIATIGLLVNILVAWIMMRSGDVEENLNMRGAYMHVISDMLGYISAIIASCLSMIYCWSGKDALASATVAALVLRRDSFGTKARLNVLMEETPENVDFDDVNETIQRKKGSEGDHDLHV